jgi:hypothetical protein
MTTFKNSVNAFGKSAGDSLSTNSTSWGGRGVLPKGKLKRYPGAAGGADVGSRRLARSNYGDGGGSGTSFCGKNAFSKGK